jgi:hypothetical protein
MYTRSRYINGRRANRTWIGFPPAGKKSKWDTTITVPGRTMQSWRHNVSSIELVYRGASSAGSQWTESRCPVATITNGSTIRVLPDSTGSGGAPVDCVADYCEGDVCPDCTSMPGHNCEPPGEGKCNKTGPPTSGAVPTLGNLLSCKPFNFTPVLGNYEHVYSPE